MLKALAASIIVSASLIGLAPGAHAQTKHKQTNQKAAKPAVTVKVKAGDNLSSIAQEYKTTYQRLYDANTSINDPDLIYPDQVIRIPDVAEQLAHRDLPANVVAPVVVPAAPASATTAPVYQASAVHSTAPAAVSTAPAAPTIQTASISGCGDNSYANYIYMHESGCRTTASSPNGCYGIGQACPASKIAYCGADYACQNAFFTQYAGRYGGWAGAYAFWTSHGWW